MVCVVWNDIVFLQITSTLVLSTIQIWYLLEYKPFVEPLMQKLEIFNEVTTIFLVFVLMCFSAANTNSVATEFPVDIVFLTFLIGNLCVHLFFLLWDICTNARRKCKLRQLKKKQQEQSQ